MNSAIPPELKARWRADGVAFLREFLGWKLSRDQVRIFAALMTHRKVAVMAAHGVGKTFLSAGIAIWHYVCFPESKTLTTAPTEPQVVGLIWGELRKAWGSRPGLKPAAPELQDPELPAFSHYIQGLTAKDANAFQGRHGKHLGIIFDEAVGIERQFYLAAQGMTVAEENWWLIIFNPTDPSTAAYAACQDPSWHVIQVSALDHENIEAELAGAEPPFPGAISVRAISEAVEQDGTPIEAVDFDPDRDIEWPPGSGRYYRPGIDLETRFLGRWPSAVTDAVWSKQVFDLACRAQPVPTFDPVELGCDVAASGENKTDIMVRKGRAALHHESHSGWDSGQIAVRLQELCNEYGEKYHQDPLGIVVKVDETGGYGLGVLDQAAGYLFVGIHSNHTPLDPESFDNRRSELWFSAAYKAKAGNMDLSRLSPASRAKLRVQLMAPRWKPVKNKRIVEPKRDTIKRLKTSPDGADALNLCFADTQSAIPMISPFISLSGGWSR